MAPKYGRQLSLRRERRGKPSYLAPVLQQEQAHKPTTHMSVPTMSPGASVNKRRFIVFWPPLVEHRGG
jgi:hypothetical protein